MSITVDEALPAGTIHALIVNGNKGDGKPTNTFNDYVVSAGGLQHNM